MNDRYLVTGKQMDILIAACKTDATTLCKAETDECNRVIHEMVEQQYVGESERAIEDDIRTVLAIKNIVVG